MLLVALTLAIGSLGIAYAMWFDKIAVTGNVTTGSVCVQFCDVFWQDAISPAVSGYVRPQNWPPPPVPTWESIYGDLTTDVNFAGPVSRLDKNVSWGEANLSADGKVLSATLHNTYPFNLNSLTVHLYNCGTVPVNYDHMDIWVTDPSVPGNKPLYRYTSDPSGIIYFDFNKDGCNDLEMVYGDHLGDQIEPGQVCRSTEISMSFLTLQCSPQGQTYKFWITFTAVQWNEYGQPVPGDVSP